MNSPEYVVIHHSLTKDSGTVSWGAIRDWHTGVHPRSPYKWTDIGYHFGIERAGGTNGAGGWYEILFGRLPHESGAHAKELGLNHKSLGVCLVGNFDLAPPPVDQWRKAVRFVRWLCGQFRTPVGHVLGHREVGLRAGFDWRQGQYKTCPGKLFDMDKFRGDLKGW